MRRNVLEIPPMSYRSSTPFRLKGVQFALAREPYPFNSSKTFWQKVIKLLASLGSHVVARFAKQTSPPFGKGGRGRYSDLGGFRIIWLTQ